MKSYSEKNIFMIEEFAFEDYLRQLKRLFVLLIIQSLLTILWTISLIISIVFWAINLSDATPFIVVTLVFLIFVIVINFTLYMFANGVKFAVFRERFLDKRSDLYTSGTKAITRLIWVPFYNCIRVIKHRKNAQNHYINKGN